MYAVGKVPVSEIGLGPATHRLLSHCLPCSPEKLGVLYTI